MWLLNPYYVYVCFLIFFVISVLGQLYLSFRQSKAVLLHRSQVPIDFQDSVSLDEHQKAADYTLAKQRFSRYEIIFNAVVLLCFTWYGGLDVLARASLILSSHPIVQGIILIGLFAAVSMVLSWPFSWYRSFRLEAQFGFNKMRLPVFVLDQVKGILLAVIIGVPLLWVVLYLMSIMGNMWWLYVWVVWVVVSLLLMWLYPKWLAPLFNKFTPLEDESLKATIEQLLARTGFHSNGIFVMDGSKRSGHGNAYFTGLGKYKRIVFFDTLLKTMQPSEIEAVLAHELGHFFHKHVFKQMMVTFVLALLVLFILGLLMPQLGFYLGLGVHYPSHAMALLLFMLVLPVFTFPFTPLSSLMSRKNEFEADQFAAHYAKAEDLICALTKLYCSNASSLVSDEWYSRFYDSHPSALKRIAALKQCIDQ